MSVYNTIYSRQRDYLRDYKEINCKIDRVENYVYKLEADIKERIAKIETNYDHMMRYLEVQLGNLLKHPYEIEKDMLIDKVIKNTATKSELMELKELLEKELIYYNEKKDPTAIAVALFIWFISNRLEKMGVQVN
ncbi:MAG: hypothetical protein QXI12_05165 [Candidatus Methanomethyliaceae archaeon]